MLSDDVRRVSPDGALYQFLKEEVLGRALGFANGSSTFDIYAFNKSESICCYFDRRTDIQLIGKSYGSKFLRDTPDGGEDLRAFLMRREFSNLQQARALGLDASPVRAVQPYAASAELNCTLFQEFASGLHVTSYVSEALEHGKKEKLLDCLRLVAEFLARLHVRSRRPVPVDDDPALRYFEKLINQLVGWRIISTGQHRRFRELGKEWDSSGILRSGEQVLIHGDANPSNFLWDGKGDLLAIDFERMTFGDPAADLGAIAAELKHLFWLSSKAPWTSEAYIKDFYESYAAKVSADGRTFADLTNRCRFYMACVELRISRNLWVDINHRHLLIDNALECLAM
jgi:aminoglycoside phosphotransferase (APT) family kinase protein